VSHESFLVSNQMREGVAVAYVVQLYEFYLSFNGKIIVLWIPSLSCDFLFVLCVALSDLFCCCSGCQSESHWLVLELSIAPQICALELGSPAVILDFPWLGFFISVLVFTVDGES
jgi:hypothetical protein